VHDRRALVGNVERVVGAFDARRARDRNGPARRQRRRRRRTTLQVRRQGWRNRRARQAHRERQLGLDLAHVELARLAVEQLLCVQDHDRPAIGQCNDELVTTTSAELACEIGRASPTLGAHRRKLAGFALPGWVEGDRKTARRRGQ
jgi:hypothetical protein